MALDILKRLKIFADERLCPDCKGKKWYWGADDWQHACETCGGRGKVKRKELEDEH